MSDDVPDQYRTSTSLVASTALERIRECARIGGMHPSKKDWIEATTQADPEDLVELKFCLQEVRVGLFAEPLARRGQSSVKKVDRKLLDLERRVGLR